MPELEQNSLAYRFYMALISALLAVVLCGAGMCVDYFIWNFSWVETDTLGEYFGEVWYWLASVAVIFAIFGFWKGEGAIESLLDGISGWFY
jgi:hypothetical protein